MERYGNHQDFPDELWRTAQEREESEFNEVFARICCVYRVKPGTVSRAMGSFLDEVTYFTYEAERAAKKKGLELHPLKASEIKMHD